MSVFQMLSKKESDLFVSFLTNKTDSLSSILTKFKSNFNERNRTVALTCIATFITDSLLNCAQQIVAVWLLANEFPNVSLVDHPFMPIFLFLFKQDSCSRQLYDILSIILSGRQIDFIGSLSVNDILNQNFEINHTNTNIIQIQNWKPRIQRVLLENVINYNNVELEDYDSILSKLLCDDLLIDFEAPFIRPVPELFPITNDELRNNFINSFDNLFLFDENVNVKTKEQLNDLINKSMNMQLSCSELSVLTNEINKNLKFLESLNFNEDEIKRISKFNPTLIKNLILTSAACDDFKILERLSQFVLNNCTKNIIENVFISNKIPENEIGKVISNIINFSKSIHDHQIYSNHVNLFCTLICNVLKNGIKFNKEKNIEIYSFCVERKNCGIKESKDLSQLLSFN